MAAIAVLAVVGVSAVSACGDIEDRSLCPAYEDFLAQRAVVQGIDLDSTSAAEAAEVADDYLDAVLRLQEVAKADDDDSRFRQPLEDLEVVARNVVATLESVPEDADSSTWEPLIEDDLQDAADAAATVVDQLEGQCPAAGDEA